MRSRKVLWGLSCLLAGSTLFADTAHADRRTGLGGNLLIQDPDDLFPFPQYALKHRNMIRLDYGAPVGGDTNRGNGVLTLGSEKRAFGLAMHRGDLLSPDMVGYNTELAWLGGVANPFGAANETAFPAPELILPGGASPAVTTVLPATVVDLMYAQSVGEGGRDSLGVRFGYGRGIQSSTTADGVSRGSSSFFAGQFGYSLVPPDGLRLDIAGNLVVSFGKGIVEDDVTNRAYDIRMGALTRGYYAVNGLVDLAFLASLNIDNEHGKSATTKSNDFSGGVMAGVGPAIHTERAQIAAYGGFTMGAGKNVPDSDDNESDVGRLNFVSPMVNMAVEVRLLDWLYVRTAAQYTWQIARFKGDDAAGDKLKERRSSAPFNWAFGLGVTKNNFFFDGVIQNALVTGGPTFIGGAENGFLAMASATYKFGDVFANADWKHKGSAAAPQETAPVAPPPPPPPPPPAPEPETIPAEPAVPEAAAPAPSASGDASATSTSTGVSGNASAGVSVGR